MSKQPTFSIIMPCYNSQEYVKNALDSIVSQTYPSWELIAINDGSTDETLPILESYAKNDERIKIFSKENGGYVSAVNLGLTKVSGDYFLFLGSDDRLAPELFETLSKHLEGCEELPDGIGFRALQFLDGIQTGNDGATCFTKFVYEPNCSFKTYLETHPNESNIFSTRDTAKCFKTAKLNGLTYFGKYGIDADGIFSILFYQNCSSFMSVPFDGYLWTLRSNSLSRTISPEKLVDRVQNWLKFYECLEQYKIETIPQPAFFHVLTPGRVCIQLCNKLKYARKYRVFVKESLRFVISIAPKYSANKFLLVKIKFLRFSPLLYSILYKIKFWDIAEKIVKPHAFKK